VPKKNKLPPEVIDHWPEVFEEIDIDVIPVEYLDSVRVQFEDGKIWDINVKSSLEKADLDIESAIEDLFEEYADVITNIDFRLDTEKVKRDIKSRTHIFMKKRK
jgi:hypothetical protein